MSSEIDLTDTSAPSAPTDHAQWEHFVPSELSGTDRYEIGVQRKNNAQARDAVALRMIQRARGEGASPPRRTGDDHAREITQDMAGPVDSSYASLHHYAANIGRIRSEDATLDRGLAEFRNRPEVEYFDEKGVLQEWVALGGGWNQLQQAWQNWRDKTLTIESALKAVAGNSSALEQRNSLKESHMSVAERTHLAALKELSRRQSEYSTKRGAR